MGEENSERGFKVQDRRRFAADGEAAAPAESEAPAPTDSGASPAQSPTAATPAGDTAGEDQGTGAQGQSLPEISFSTLLISLSTQALVLLGEVTDPTTQGVEQDLAGAKQLIDILGVLEEKTKGNLDSSESTLLENVLYNLRMQYVRRAREK